MEITSVDAVGRAVREVDVVGNAVPFVSWNMPPLFNVFEITIPSQAATPDAL
jgi:hypothetical protein